MIIWTNKRNQLFNLVKQLSTSSSPTTVTASAGINKGPTTVAPAQNKLAKLVNLVKEIVPGNSPLAKAVYACGIVSGSAALVNSGYYTPGEDTLTLTSFLILMRLLYLKAGKPLSEYLQTELDADEKKWYADREREKIKYSSQLVHLETFRDYGDVVSAMYDMKAANVVLEDALNIAQAKYAKRNEVYTKAQELVRKEQERIIEEEKENKRKLREELLLLLRNDKIQERIMEKFINNLSTN